MVTLDKEDKPAGIKSIPKILKIFFNKSFRIYGV